MMISKMALPRRTFLRGMGVTLALPLLDAMVPALTATSRTPANPVRRVGFFYFANGAAPGFWVPNGDGTEFELSPSLLPLEPVRQHVVIPTGLDHRQAEAFGDGNGEHSRGTATFLSGVHCKYTEGADVRAGTTVDQIAARELGKDTRLPSLEMCLDPTYLVGSCENGYSCHYMNTISWRTPTQPNPMENDPRAVFERLFGEGGTWEQRQAQLRTRRSVLDGVLGDMSNLGRTLGPSDRRTMDEYVETIREVERRIQHAEKEGADSVLPPVLERPVGIPESYDDHARLMFDLLVLAYQADITRVATHMLCRETSSRSYPWIGVPDGHHNISHHQHDPVKLAKYSKVNAYHVSLFASFLEKLQAIPDGDGSLLDHSLMLYGSGLSDGDRHDHINLPVILAGGAAGGIKGGRHLKYAQGTPMSNLFLSVLDKVGVPAEALGDSTGRLPIATLADL